MKKETKSKQIIVKLDDLSYDKIINQANIEHRCKSEFVRYAVLYMLQNNNEAKEASEG